MALFEEEDSKPISMHPREEMEIAWGPGIG